MWSSFLSDDVTEDDQFDQVASRLTEIADEIPFTPPEVESDAPDGESCSELVVNRFFHLDVHQQV